MTTNEQENTESVIKSRVFHLIFEPPFFSMARGCYTTFTQDDLINLLRQVKNPKLKHQFREFIEVVDRQQDVITDIETYKLPRTQKEIPEKRAIISYKHNKK